MKISFTILILPSIMVEAVRSQIFDGRIASEGEFPYLVSISYCGSHICGGAIIDEAHILTAAHCLYKRLLAAVSIRAGTTELEDPYIFEKSVKNIHFHPNMVAHPLPVYVTDIHGFYALTQMENDIAVITLVDAIEFSDTISSIDLPYRDVMYCGVSTLAGWGLTAKNGTLSNDLMWMTLMILDAESCRSIGFGHRVEEFCALSTTATAGPGDSGGPLVHDGRVVGIEIAGFSDPRFPIFFANVYHHLEFIKQAMND